MPWKYSAAHVVCCFAATLHNSDLRHNSTMLPVTSDLDEGMVGVAVTSLACDPYGVSWPCMHSQKSSAKMRNLAQ